MILLLKMICVVASLETGLDVHSRVPVSPIHSCPCVRLVEIFRETADDRISGGNLQSIKLRKLRLLLFLGCIHGIQNTARGQTILGLSLTIAVFFSSDAK
jgi:hypothetical protein